ncbi:MAG TPA: DUF4386 domain-containing protein [Terriglobales bacterium]|nr:DUF4386 domain-containing protein [Terriglobales bacterium]
MTRTTNARLAGFTFLAYIATGIASMVLFGQAAAGANAAAKLASIAQHATAVRLTAVLTLVTFFEAVVLGVTLFALTHEEDFDLAVLGLCCRVGEGVLGAASAVRTVVLLPVAASATSAAPDAAAATALGASLLSQGGSSTAIGATCFAVGSTLFSYLFLRARSIPVPLAWLGVLASVLLVVGLPVQLAGFLPASLAWPIWMPMLAFELTLAFWLLMKGVAAPARKRSDRD